MKRVLPWLAVLALAAAVRAPALTAARPYINYVDEGNYLHVSARMLRHGGWIPDDFMYPSLPITAVAAVVRVVAPAIPAAVLTQPNAFYDVLEPFELLLLGRVLSFLAGLGIVLLTGLLASRVAGWRAGLLAAFTAALLPALVIRGGIATVNSFATLFVTACLLFTERTRACGHARDALIAGAMAGFAFASKYPAILVSLAFALTVGIARQERLRLWSLGAAGAVAGALLAMPGIFVAPQKVLGAIRNQSELYGTLPSPALWRQAFERAEWDLPFPGPELGWVFVALALAGMGAALWDRRTRASALGWSLFAAVALVLYSRQSFQPFRNLLPLLPIACVAVSILFERIRESVSRPALADAAAFLLTAALLAPPAIRFARERARFEDSRTQVIDWLERNSVPDQRVLVLEELAFLPSELERLKGRVVAVHSWEVLQRRLRRRQINFLVLTEMVTPEGQPLPSPEGRQSIARRYQPRIRFGEEGTPPHKEWWHGNRQSIYVLERRRP